MNRRKWYAVLAVVGAIVAVVAAVGVSMSGSAGPVAAPIERPGYPQAPSTPDVEPSAEATTESSADAEPSAEAEPSARAEQSEAPRAEGDGQFDEPAEGAGPDAQGGQGGGTSLADAAGEANGSGQAGAGPPDGRRERELGPGVDPVTPEEMIGDGRGLGGCLKQYGANGQCLPNIPPSQAKHAQDMRDQGEDPAEMEHQWSCDEVRQYFPDGVLVRVGGVDPLGLDTNKDGIACGAGD